MELIVHPSGLLAQGQVEYAGQSFRCALGRGGVAVDKREGDGATPIGSFPLRQVFYRADRCNPPHTGLPVRAITPHDGWCDDPACAAYNTLVPLPHPGSHEVLWRDDGLYDLLAVIGYNDAPVVPGHGSAIFMHVASADYTATAGCVALSPADLRAALAQCDETTTIRILPDIG